MLSASRSKATVLVVEDDAIPRELLTQLLLASGYDVIPASTGECALLILCRKGEEIDWLVSKEKLPGLVCGWILADEYRQHHPDRSVLLISPEPDPAKKAAARVEWIPPASPVRVLEVLQALKAPEPVPARTLSRPRAA